MAVTANQLIVRRDGNLVGYSVAATIHVYQGTLVFLANGYASNAISASGANRFGGVSTEEKDNSGGADGDENVLCWAEGEFELPGSGFTPADVGKIVHATDNYTVNVVGSGVRIGRCVGYISASRIRVKLEVENGEQPMDTNTETLAANKTIAIGDPMIQALDPGGSGRDVTLPAVTGNKGLQYIIRNTADAAEVLTIKNAGGTTICTPTQNETAWVFCDGTAWYGQVAFHN